MLINNKGFKIVSAHKSCGELGLTRRVAALVTGVAVAQSLSARCGAVDYSQTAQALALAHMWLCTTAVYVFWLIEALGGIMSIIGAFMIYVKMQLGEQGVLKDILMLFFGILFLLAAAIVYPAMFGYNYSGVRL